jgi:hypothetical protein
MENIEVVELRAVQKGCLKAFVDVLVGDFEIRGLRIIQQPNQRPFIHFPMVEYEQGGQRLYAPVIRLHDAKLEKDIKAKVLAACQSQNQKN